MNRCSAKVPINESYPLLGYNSEFGVVDENFYLGDNPRSRSSGRNVLDNETILHGADALKDVDVHPMRNLSSNMGPKSRLVAAQGEFNNDQINSTRQKQHNMTVKGRSNVP